MRLNIGKIDHFFDMNSAEITLDPSFGPETYVGKLKATQEEQAKKYERPWPVSTVINALLGAGLRLERFEEYPDAYWKEFPNMPEETRTKFPNTFSLLMVKP